MHIKNLDKRNSPCGYSTMLRLSERDTSLTCNLTANESWFNEINASSDRSHAARCSRAVRVRLAIHISTLRKMLQAGDPVDISLWKSNGEILHYRNAVPLRYDFYKGTRRIKLLDSRECCEQVSKSINWFCFYNEQKQLRRGQIRTVRDVCIFKINGMEVFM